MANAHQLDIGENGESPPSETDGETQSGIEESVDEQADTFHAFLASRGKTAPPADLRNVLSTSSKRPATSTKSRPAETRKANMHRIAYIVGKHRSSNFGSLVDRGANGGVAGNDVRIISTTHRAVSVQGVSNHQVNDLKIVTAGGVVTSQHGPVIAIFNQYAHIGTGKTIHSSLQMEEFGLDVNEKPIQVPGGLQRIKTPDGYVHPIAIKDGLPYVSLRPYTDEEWETLPHVIWTRDQDWDPSVFDHEFDEDGEEWYDAVTDLAEQPNCQLFDEFGNYRKREAVVVEEHFIDCFESPPDDPLPDSLDIDDIIDNCVDYQQVILVNERRVEPLPRRVTPSKRDYGMLRRFFGWSSADVVEKTFACTTQMGRLSNALHLKKQFRSPNPAMNVHRRMEPVATD